MSPEQRRLARHALGLPNRYRRSYRNRFFSGGECPDWRAMEAAGHAESGDPDEYGRIWFWLTRAGAEAALEPGERLCREDFPPPPAARDASGRFARRPPQSSPLTPGAYPMPTTTKDEAARTPGQVARDSFPERRGDWMQTYSGRRFWPLDPRAEDVAIEDIAHALSLQTRFGGHCLRFYSVAEHCVHLARSASKEAALWLLLHDGSEAYLSDMVRPLKRHMPEYRAAEDRVAWAVYEAFDLDPGMEPAEVKERDCRILIDERAQVMLATGEAWNYGGATEPLGVTLQFWTPEQAEREFLATYSAITGQSVAMPTSPAPASPGVPDSLRALSEGLQHSFMVTRSDHARERYRIEITCPGLVSMQDMHSALVAVQSGRPFVSADAQWREALAPFVAHYQSWMDEWPGDTECTVYARPITFGDLRRARALLATHPAGQSEQPVLRAVIEVYPDRTDTRLTFGDRIRPEPGVKAVEQAIAALTAEYKARGGCPVVGRHPAGQSAEPRSPFLGGYLHDRYNSGPRPQGVVCDPAGQSAGSGASEPCAWAGGNDTCYCRTCGEEYRYGREDKPACPKKPAPDSTRTGQAEETVAVPASALRWLFGEGPDADGVWFGDQNRGKGAFWWRSEFRKRIEAARPATPEAQGAWRSQAALDVLAERRRQVEAEGWTPEHDDAHALGEIAAAAGTYALVASGRFLQVAKRFWPWDFQWWKPCDARRNLVKSAALSIAEIERIDRRDRLPAPPASSGQGGR